MSKPSVTIRTSPLLLSAFIAVILALGPAQCKKFEVSRKVILTTDQVSQVSQRECLVTGTVMDLNDQIFPNHGFHWATSMDAIHPGDTVNLGRIAQVREISINIRRFEPGTHYFIWIYVNDGSGEIRADPQEFTTLPAEIPTVETGAVNVTGPTTAECSYNILWNGELPIIHRGLCWGETELPAIDGPHSEEGTGTGEYTGTMSELTPGTTYRVRAYAVNGIGIAYGEPRTFSTPAGGDIPTVTTNEPGEVGPTTAVLGGSISSDGGLPITEKGICYGLDPDPDVGNNTWPMGTGPDPFSDMVAELTPDTHYFYKAYAVNSAGPGYGNQFEFHTATVDLVDERNGNVYPTVRIGEQVWMARNLDIGDKINGSLNASDDGTIQKYCYQNNDTYCEQYGALYSWEEMMQYNLTEGSQGVCPDGWHIPTDQEWKILELTLGVASAELESTGWRGTDQGGKLKVPGTDLWNEPNLGATNETQFSALPAGGVDHIGVFDGRGLYTDFWTSSLLEPNPWFRHLDAEHSGILRDVQNKDYGRSVRCIRDSE